MGSKLKDARYDIAKLFNAISRIAVYLASLGIAVRALGVEETTLISRSLVAMAQTIVTGVATFTIDVVFVETVVDFSKKIIGSMSPYLNLTISAAYLIPFFAVALIALSLAGVDVSPVISLIGNLSPVHRYQGRHRTLDFAHSLHSFESVYRGPVEEHNKQIQRRRNGKLTALKKGFLLDLHLISLGQDPHLLI